MIEYEVDITRTMVGFTGTVYRVEDGRRVPEGRKITHGLYGTRDSLLRAARITARQWDSRGVETVRLDLQTDDDALSPTPTSTDSGASNHGADQGSLRG